MCHSTRVQIKGQPEGVSFLFVYRVAPRGGSQVVRLGGECLHQLGHLASPCAYGSAAPLKIYVGDHPEIEKLINNGVNECKV